MTVPSSNLTEALSGRYTIDREIGRGGMASVYLAHDVRHNRPVALKLLHPQLAAVIGTERFLREIQVVARLRHPHIVPLYDSGEADGRLYYVMPYVKGESIRERLARSGRFSQKEAIVLVREIADALSYAHAEGVVHRDIKPDNIMLDERHAMITDFGIARALSLGANATLTEAGLLIGTPAYMSPEQITGEDEIDGRSDIYSLGCVLYEMLAGEPAFSAGSAQAVMAKRFSAPTPTLESIGETSPGLKKIVAKAMRLSPTDRYDTAQQMIDALDSVTGSESASGSVITPRSWSMRTLAGSALAALAVIAALLFVSSRDKKNSAVQASDASLASIGVLPFANQSGDKEMEYFTDGLTDELISALSHVTGLQVAGRASSFAMKGKNLDAVEAAKRLQVAYVVDAGVRSGESRVRVTWQIMDGRTGRGLASGDIDGEMRDVIALQDSMAKKIVEGLSPVVGIASTTSLRKHQTADFEAHDLYLKGHFLWNQRTPESMRQAITYLKKAIEKDPGYALAWAELSSAYTLEPAFGDMPPSEVIQPARDAAKKAVDLDPTLSEAYTALGMSLTFNDWNAPAALPYLEKAIALDPQNSFPHLFRVWPLMMLNRTDEGLAELRKARELDPLSAIVNTRIGTGLIFKRRYDEAVVELRKALQVDPSNLLARFELGRALAAAGKFDEAFAQFPDAVDAEGGIGTSYAAWAYGRAGRPDKARLLLGRLQARSKERYLSPLCLVTAAAAAGDKSLALDYLEQALAGHGFHLTLVSSDPIYDVLRDEPRYKRVMREVERKYAHLKIGSKSGQ